MSKIKAGEYILYKKSGCLFNIYSFSRKKFQSALQDFKRLNKYYLKELLNKCLINEYYRQCDECIEAFYKWCQVAINKVIITKGWVNKNHKKIMCDNFIEYILTTKFRYNRYKTKHPAFFLVSLLKVLYYQFLKEQYKLQKYEMLLDSENESLSGNLSETEMPDFVYYKDYSFNRENFVNETLNKNYNLYEKVFNTLFEFYVSINKLDKDFDPELKFQLKNKFIDILSGKEFVFQKLTKHAVITDLIKIFCEIMNIKFAKIHVKKFKKFLLSKK